jgi:SOS response regulatory protein OraA/RecX
MTTLPELPPVADMSLRELRAELAAHGYEADEIASVRNWSQAAEMVESLRIN